MIAGLPIAFGAPAILFGLLALPVIWWLLRLTPPRPRAEPFAPLAILARVLKTEETPARSPWWLTALRLLIAALVILALAEPVLDPRDRALSADGPLALVIDNGWASAPDWQARTDAAEALIDEAEDMDIPVSIVLTANRRHNATPSTFEQARDQLRAAKPQPLHPERNAAVTALVAALGQTRPGTIAYITDGLETPDTADALNRLAALEPSAVRVLDAAEAQTVALTAADNGADALDVTANRLSSTAAERFGLTASDSKGREIATGEIRFEAGESQAIGTISAPFEIRNDIARLDITGIDTAGSVRLLDDSFRRRRVALISGEAADIAQPLLSPLYYINRALSPYADLIEADTDQLSVAIPKLLAQAPAVILMSDIGTLPEDASRELGEWIERGGTLVRFAGPRLAATDDDQLLPVLLRKGERELGGALSWIEPQPLADYPATGPFAGLPTPRDITIRRQVLAEPSADLAERTWASLADGTPLVTAADRGAGRVVLFHVTAEASWSNLPISGHFVDMLRRVVQLSRAISGGGEAGTGILPPWRLLDANGGLLPAAGDARPLDLSGGGVVRAGPDNPPGLYGGEDGFVALNLFEPGDTLMPIDIPQFEVPVSRTPMAGNTAVDFRPWLFGAALLALLADTLIVLFLNGAFRGRGLKPASGAAALLLAAAFAVSMTVSPGPAAAQDAQPGDAELLASLDRTHLAYVITGDDEVDNISKQGLDSLSRYLLSRTALEPGNAVGVDIETDQLALYPLIYWPMSEDADLPSNEAISRIDAYMKNGGTVLFDTRDRIVDLGGGSSALTLRLQRILANLDIPPLEPVPSDHVLTKAFFLLETFPGRYSDGPLWVEAIPETTDPAERPARTGDGVSSILITGNDMAAAWAVDEQGFPMFSTIPADPWQREYAFRAGVNIVMYMLTGNYKADQVHVPALLERLGQ